VSKTGWANRDLAAKPAPNSMRRIGLNYEPDRKSRKNVLIGSVFVVDFD
jgi:hypothetical protein